MDGSTFEAIHRYGAALSVVASAIAVVVYVFGGPDGIVGLFFGWAGPLGVFYFGGAYLSYATPHRVVGEELLRGVAWYFGSLVAWSVVVSTTTSLSASPFTAFGVPALIALGITLVMITVRYETGSELKVETESGRLLVQLLGGIAFGFLALYLVLADQAGWWVFGLYLLSIPVGLAIWRATSRRYPGAFGAD